MADIFLKIVNMSISASWIALAVLILRLLLKKAPKWITVLLWGIVAVRLVCPFNFEKNKLEKTKNTYAIHWFNGSWVPTKDKIKVKLYRFLAKIFGEKNIQKVSKKLNAEKK